MIRFLIKRPVFVAMLLIGLSLLGIVSYRQLPVELFPNTELPMLIVDIRAAGDADPAYVEHNGVIPMESAIAGLDHIELIESTISRQRATIIISYSQSANPKYAYLKLQECVAANLSKMGEGFTATVYKVDPEQLANQFILLQARGEGSLDQIRTVVEEKVVPELESVDGIANVEVYGGRRRSIEVILDEDELKAYRLTPSQVSSRIAEGRSQRQYLGQAWEGGKRYFVNLVADYISLSDLGDVVVKDQGPVLLKHIASIVEGGAEEESISRVNGMESVAVSLIRNREANLLNLAKKTRKTIAELQARIASDGITLVIESDAAEVIEENINSILMLALVGSLLAVGVLWVFLKSLPLVLVVIVTIPISILISLNLFYALDISINTLTLVGIAIAVGMLLDNSVVVLENIHRKLAKGMNVEEAVVTGTGEVKRAIFAATLTTVAVFLPFLFSRDFLVRILGRQVGVAIISTLMVSLAVAFLLIPAFSYRYLSSRKSAADFRVIPQKNRAMQIYTVLLKSCLRFPARTVMTGIVVLFVSLALCLAISVNVPEEVELDEFNLYALMPSGTTLEKADEQVKEMDTQLESISEIEERLATIQEDNVAFHFKLKEAYEDIAERDLDDVKALIMGTLENTYPRVDFTYDEPTQDVRYQGGSRSGEQRFSRMLGIGASQEKVIVRGQDLELMRAIAEDIQFGIDSLDNTRSSRVSITSGQPSIDLHIDRSALNHFDVSLQTVSGELASFRREFSSGVTFKQGTEEIDIILKEKDEEEKTSDDLRQLDVPSNSGGSVPLLQLSQMVYARGSPNINRSNQEKQVEITYRFDSYVEESSQLLEAARSTVEQVVADISSPPGVAIEVVHDESELSEFYFLIGIAIILIYMVLASAFESLVTPFAMMFTLPLATIGAFWGLILTGNSVYNANALVGFLILLGVVVNNGILLIDYSRQLHRRRFRLTRALLTAGQSRVRPILITSITTILAMLPIAMGKAEYISQIGAPFAITVIGGLSVATLFTLILVPTVSFGLENALQWWRRQSWLAKGLELTVLAAGIWLIHNLADSPLWEAIYITVWAAAIPAFAYFAQVSLRRSQIALIPPGQPLKITIRNISKLYDDFSRFMREWRKGRKKPALDYDDDAGRKALKFWMTLSWQLPLYAFLLYFTYVYLKTGFWSFVFSVAAYVATLAIVGRALGIEQGSIPGGRFKRLRRVLYKILFWVLPLANLGWYRLQWKSLTPVIMTGILWYAALAVTSASQKLYRENIDINRISGRFKRLRKAFYRFVKVIPVLGKKRRPFQALKQVSLEIGSGMFGLIGPNGAGKTTLMRIICGILPASQGIVTFNQFDLSEKREELQSLIGYLPQEFGTYENMTAYQFLDYQAMLKGIWNRDKRREIVDKALNSVHLTESRNLKIKTFSGGMKQRVGIAMTLLHLPRILVVDEPTAGLDPRERIRFRNLLSELARERVVIFSTHIIEDISSSCNRLAVLFGGEVRFEGTPQELTEQARGSVWQARLSEEEFENIRQQQRIVYHMRDGERIRVRILAREKPLPEAIAVEPTLEDSYMLLLKPEN